MPNKDLIKAGEVASLCGVTVITLQRWRQRGTGPRYYIVSHRSDGVPNIRYDRADVEHWLENRFVATSDE